jgi:hypothetical protein
LDHHAAHLEVGQYPVNLLGHAEDRVEPQQPPPMTLTAAQETGHLDMLAGKLLNGLEKELSHGIEADDEHRFLLLGSRPNWSCVWSSGTPQVPQAHGGANTNQRTGHQYGLQNWQGARNSF